MYTETENGGAAPAKSEQQRWMEEITAAQKELGAWHESATKVVDLYMDNRTTSQTGNSKFNLFTANVGILQSALFSRIPKPDVSRRFKDATDQVGRVAANLIQRAITTELETGAYFSTTAKDIIKDRLIPGAGVAWVRYVPTYAGTEPLQPTTDANAELAESPTAGPVVTDETTPIEHVVWKDFLYSPCRVWSECRWVARAVHMSTEEISERFGQETADQISMSVAEADGESMSDGYMKNRTVATVKVWEIWCKDSKRVYFYCEHASDILESKDDPFGLPHFFPTPKPLLGITSTLRFVPVPDYKFVQDQYEELNTLNSRISNLISACKVAGAFDKSNKALGQLFSASTPETYLVPVDRWDAFAEKGGLRGAIDFVPIDQISAVIAQLNAAREITKAQIYELTGISDIIRGQSGQYETLGAQNMKAQYAGLRLATLQQEVAEFMSELMQIKAFLMVKFYEPQRLVAKAGAMMPQDQLFLPAALQMLKNELLAYTHIEISVDALQSPNDFQDKQDRAEVVTAVSNLLSQGVQIGQQAPALAPVFLQLIKFAVSAHKGAKDIEGFIDAELQKMAAQAQAAMSQPPAPAPPSPELIKLQMAQQEQAQSVQLQQAKLQADMQIEQAKITANAQIAQQKLQQEAALAQAEMSQRAAMETARINIEQRKLDIELAKLSQHGEIKAAEMQAAANQVATPAVQVGSNKEDIAAMIEQQGQVLISAISAMVNAPEEPATIVVERNADGQLVGTIT